MQAHSNPDPLLPDPLVQVELELSTGPIVRALVIGDDPLVRDGFVRRLGREAAGEADPRENVAEAVSRYRANLVVWDLGPHGSDDAPFETVSVPVVALASGDIDAAELIGRGAAGVLRRNTPADALRSALDTVLHGLVVVEPSFLELPAPAAAVDDAPVGTGKLADALTSRETQVLELMAEGLSNKRIADRLGISTHTAKFHIAAILDKLDASTRTEAVVKAVQRGVLML